ncbi:MAG: ribonuclease Y [Deltaproteobacteria bacterium]|nr:ribonuclease Y [Deltaproteobacteria bacterium]
MSSIIGGLIGLIALLVGSVLGFLVRKKLAEAKIQSAEAQVQNILEEGKKRTENLKKEAELEIRDQKLQAKSKIEEEIKNRKSEVVELEKRILAKENILDKKSDNLERKDQDLIRKSRELEGREQQVKTLEGKYQELVEEQKVTLEKVAGMTSEEAKKKLTEGLLEQAKLQISKEVKQYEEACKSEVEKRSRRILSQAIERLAGEWVTERTITVVHLTSDEMKGRIIGREGRNIRTIEQLTGVDLIVDDTPNAVVLSAYNPVRREIARIVLEKLMQDGRIHPTRIEEMVEKVNREMETQIKETGEAAVFELGIHGMHPELVRLLGMLKFRTSYAQNVLTHSIEVGFLAGIMAAELGINEKMARRAGLLHDIGKAVSHEVEGSHAIIGADIAKKYGEDPRVVHAIAAHHEDVPQETALAHIVDAADALSGARPGARSEVLESYVKRVEELEKIATSFPGVNKAFAIQAGREIRVLVENDKISDDKANVLCHDIARKIEDNLTYPGQIKVTVVRELRVVDYAK